MYKNEKKSMISTALVFIYLCGIVLGALSMKNTDNSVTEYIKLIADEYISSLPTYQLADYYIVSFAGCAFTLVAMFICGFCAVAQPAVLLLSLIEGISFGLLSAYIYLSQTPDGIMILMLFIIPKALILLGLITCFGNRSVLFSNRLFSAMLTPNCGGAFEGYDDKFGINSDETHKEPADNVSEYPENIGFDGVIGTNAQADGYDRVNLEEKSGESRSQNEKITLSGYMFCFITALIAAAAACGADTLLFYLAGSRI